MYVFFFYFNLSESTESRMVAHQLIEKQTNKAKKKIAFRQVNLGKDPVSEHTRRHVAEEREIAFHEYMVRFLLTLSYFT